MASLGHRMALLASLLLLTCTAPVTSQTYSVCNPLTQGSCPADPALAKTVNIDFTQGASNSFSASGAPAPSYGSNGAAFTVAQSGDSPTITSKWYIMFGHVDFVIKAAPGTGIVSSAILQSDDLDEIDWEWLGGDDTQVQSNYFGKGLTTSYNRGAFHAAANNHDQFMTYSIDWTANQIVWSINGQTVRVLTAAAAVAGQYPQTPMQIKVGVWAGGDPSNSPGTIQWAGGLVNYGAGPYTMYLKSMRVQDYSTGSSYSYSGTSGTWESIVSNGGAINPSGTSSGSPSIASQPVVSTATGAPAPFSTSPEQSSVYATRTGYPWIVGTASTLTTRSAVATSYSGLPSGWIITDSGKVVPPSTGSPEYPSTSFSQVSVSASLSASETEITTTTYDQQGFPTLTTITVFAQPTYSDNPISQVLTSTSDGLSSPAITSTAGSLSSEAVTSASDTLSTQAVTSTSKTQSSQTTFSTSSGFPPNSHTLGISTAFQSTSSGLPAAVKAANAAVLQQKISSWVSAICVALTGVLMA